MKRMKKTISAVLAMLMVLTSVVFTTASVTAESTSNLSDNLLIHYDFEGSPEDVLKDKASGTANTKADDLVVYSIADGTVEDFSFENGIVTSNSTDSMLVAAADSNDMWVNSQAEVTWFVRYNVTQTPTFVSGSDAYIFDMSHTAWDGSVRNSMYLDMRKDTKTRWGGWNTGTNYRNEIATNLWNDTGWMNVVITRTKNETTGQYDFTLKAYNNELELVGQDTHSDSTLATNACPRISLFGSYNERSNYTQQSYGFADGLAIDDFRLYNVALSEDQVKDLIQAEFLDTESEGGSTLLVHYDFNGTTAAEVLKDKAAGGSVSDDLACQLWSGADYSSVFSDVELSTYFTFENGVITSKVFGEGDSGVSNSDKVVLHTAVNSADIQTVNKAGNQNATWFVRYKVNENYTGPDGDTVIFDANHSGKANHSYGFRRGSTETRSAIFNQSHIAFTNGRTLDEWRNTVITKAYGDDGSCTVTHVTFNDSLKTLEYSVKTYENAITIGDEWGYLSLFGVMNEANIASKRSGGVNSVFKGLSIDDFRIYSESMTLDEIQNLIIGDFLDGAIYTKGIQYSEVDDDGNFGIRMIAMIKGMDYNYAGFTVSGSYVNEEGTSVTISEQNLYTTVAYKGLAADGVINAIQAPEGYYLIAVKITDISEKITDFELTITSFAVPTEGERVTGESASINYSYNGEGE